MKHEVSMDVGSREVPLALSGRQLAEKLGVSLRHVRRGDAAGWLPRPIRIGRSVRWPVEEIHAWMKAGAPPRRQWEHIRDRQNGRRH